MKTIWTFFLIVFTLSGCAATKDVSEGHISSTLVRNISKYVDTQRKNIEKNDLDNVQKSQFIEDCSLVRDSHGIECLYEKERNYLSDYQRNWPPKLGLALSGGGTRAASFSIGVLKALHENGTLEKVDVISSVSGGSYAAYWYFSQIFYMDALLKACKALEEKREFQMFCHESLIHTHRQESANQQGDAWRYRAEAEIFRTWGDSQTNLDEPNQYRFQRTLEESSKILAFAHKPSFTKGMVAGFQYGVETIIQGLSIPIHWVANGLFDWETNITPFFYFYKDGLDRTYGYVPLDYTLEHFANANSIWFNRVHNVDAEPILMSNVAEFLEDKNKNRVISKAKRLPYFIINTTARYGRLINRYGQGKKRTVENSVFEFTPWGCYSDLLNIRNTRDQTTFCPKDFSLVWPPLWQELDLARLVAISGGAVDGQASFVDIARREEVPYSILGRKWYEIALDVGNFNLGYQLQNQKSPEWQRWFHKLLPWPLYHLHDYTLGDDATSIYLSDGGHSENLGILSLVRRGVKTIIVVDAEHDPDSVLESAKRLKNTLSKYDLTFKLNQKNKNLLRFKDVTLENSIAQGTIISNNAKNENEGITVIYIKLSAPDSSQEDYKTLPYTVRSYMEQHPNFPQESTTDVFFGADQFRAYRDLGYTIGRRLR